jgi:hypothetical protein
MSVLLDHNCWAPCCAAILLQVGLDLLAAISYDIYKNALGFFHDKIIPFRITFGC